MPNNDTPTLTIYNQSGNLFPGCPCKINEVARTVSPKGVLDLTQEMGKKVYGIEVNGVFTRIFPAREIKKGMHFTFSTHEKVLRVLTDLDNNHHLPSESLQES